MLFQRHGFNERTRSLSRQSQQSNEYSECTFQPLINQFKKPVVRPCLYRHTSPSEKLQRKMHGLTSANRHFSISYKLQTHLKSTPTSRKETLQSMWSNEDYPGVKDAVSQYHKTHYSHDKSSG